MEKPKLMILIGPPGSGKGTQAKLLADELGFLHLEISKILEQKFRQKSGEETINVGDKEISLKEQKRRWQEGLLCEDEFVAYTVGEKLRKMDEEIILDGFPRTIRQWEPVAKVIFSLYDPVIIFLEVTEEESIRRNTNRQVCSLMRHSIIDDPQTRKLTICPLDGSLLKRRQLDKEETIKVRLSVFKESTAPVLEYLSKSGVKILRINGMGTVAEVFQSILNVLSENK